VHTPILDCLNFSVKVVRHRVGCGRMWKKTERGGEQPQGVREQPEGFAALPKLGIRHNETVSLPFGSRWIQV